MKYLKFTLALALIAFFTSCSKDEEVTPGDPAEQIVGTWAINSSKLLGVTIPGGGATLTFNTCGVDVCSGSDYENFDKTTGEFTYTLSTDGKTLTIVDGDQNGGAYNGAWDVTSMTNSSLEITSSSILGDFVLIMSK